MPDIIVEEAECIAVPPQTINSTRTYAGRLLLAGEGPERADIMFVSTTVQDAEVKEDCDSNYGLKIKQKPRFGKGPAASMFKDLVESTGIVMSQCFYTALCRWSLPKTQRSRPKAVDIRWGTEMLNYEIRKVKPRLIVCLGKPPFDLLSQLKVSARDLGGGLFTCAEHNCLLYPMPDIHQLVAKPELMGEFRSELLEIARTMKALDGTGPPQVEKKYEVIKTAAELFELTTRLMKFSIFSVDCEWHGRNFIDGQLRSIQVAWAPGEAAYIRLMDDAGNYTFDVGYKEAGAILGMALDRPDSRYVGHHISADLPWMHHWLGLKWHNRTLLDTEFADQLVDEYHTLGLDRVALRYTDLGRYDVELMLWSKSNKGSVEGGYGFIPDDILINYACSDVDTVIRAYPHIINRLIAQEQWTYYVDIVNPFVADVFTGFAIQGLDMDMKRIDELRELYSFARDEMRAAFQHAIRQEAKVFLKAKCVEQAGDLIGDILYRRLLTMEDEPPEALNEMIAAAVGPAKLIAFEDVMKHFEASKAFNPRSPDMARRWLFKVKGYTPIKSTGNRDKGMPSMSWDRVLALPPSRQVEFTPAADKQTLQILSVQHDDDMLKRLLELYAVTTLTNGVMKEATEDEDGNITKENGLPAWIARDGKIHGMMSTTETGRARSWSPNLLNLPSFVQDRIKDGMKRLFVALNEEGRLPAQFLDYARPKTDPSKRDIPSIRSCICALPGWVIVELDYQTAEIRSLAWFSGDTNLIRLLTEPDEDFAFWKGDGKTVVRVRYSPDSGITPEHADPALLMSCLPDDAKPRLTVTDADLLRDAAGNVLHPRHDLHWSLAERVHGKPRECMDAKKDRGSAKIIVFSSSYGATPATMERKIESDVGYKPEPGTGQRSMDALAARQPVATEFLERMQEIPKSPGFWRAPSGRLRRFVGHPDHVSGISNRERDGAFGAMGREMRNFPPQNSVADTSAIACIRLLEFGIRNGLQGRPIFSLYDSVGIHCPEEERLVWDKACRLFMTASNGWWINGRVLRYTTDREYNRAWSENNKKLQKQWESKDYKPTPAQFKGLEDWLDQSLAFFEEHELASVYNKKDITATIT